MNKKNLLILIVAAAVLGAAGIAVFKKNQSQWSESGEEIGDKLIADFPINDVAEVSLEDKDGNVQLRKQGESWVVVNRNGYPANFDDIQGLLTGIWRMEAI